MGYILPGRGSVTLAPSASAIPTPPRASSRIDPDTQHELETVLEVLDAHRAIDVVVLDLRKLSDATDFFVIASGSSDTHVRALAEHVIEELRRRGRRAHHLEGVPAGRWALLDYVDVVVHLFHPTLRSYYQLERLWADAPGYSVEAGR